jgi:hypothetical protein
MDVFLSVYMGFSKEPRIGVGVSASCEIIRTVDPEIFVIGLFKGRVVNGTPPRAITGPSYASLCLVIIDVIKLLKKEIKKFDIQYHREWPSGTAL